MNKIVKEIDGICPACGSSQMSVHIGEDIFDRTIRCCGCAMVIECPRCSSTNVGYFESNWICGDCIHDFNRYPGTK